MNCQDYQRSIADLLAGTIGAADQDRLLRHADACNRCRQVLLEYQQADATLKQAFCAPSSPAEAREAVLARLAQVPAASQGSARSPAASALPFAIRWAIAASILLAVGLLGGFAIGRARLAAASPTARAIPLQVAAVQGTVLVKHTGMNQWEELTPSAQILLGDMFHTAGKAGATLTLWDKSSIELKANTTLSADAFNGEVQFTLRSGTIKADLESEHSPFFIRTPQGRLQALGTEFVVSVD